ncbi:hypothetical protein BGZ51_002020 [Haplosporangium sp. Z 767]|nr:hypothetical protein BGZ51_002020 [Haplosporangium sp. Z 767]
MADLDAIYNAYHEINDAKEKAPEHLDAYSTIIAGAQGSDNAKRLAAQFIPTFFKHFPTLHSKAIDGIFDLCEDDSNLIRQMAIKTLPLLCKDGPQYTIKIADVLCQLLQLDDQDLVVVQGALQTLMLQSPREVLAVVFRQGVKGADLRERSLDFITNQVMACKETLFKDPEIEMFFLEEMQKAMISVSNSELEMFARIIMERKPYQTGKLDLTGLLNTYVNHITSEKPFNITDPESVKRVLIAGKLSMPLFKRTISADPLLEFFATYILPRDIFGQLEDKQKTFVLRVYADSITTGHASATILKHAGELVANLLVSIVPAELDATSVIEFTQVECLTNVLYFISAKQPDIADKDELAPRYRNLYVSTQNQISGLKQSLATASIKIPQDAEQTATIKSLTRTILMHNNIHNVVKEFMKPKNLRSTKAVLHPSWRPSPEPAKPSVPKSTIPPKATTAAAVKSSAGASAKQAAKPNAKAGSKPSSIQQQVQQQLNGANKRKAEAEASAKPKKPKIVRRHGSNTGGNSPGSNSPGGSGNKGSKQNQAQPQQQHISLVSHSSQSTQQGKKGSSAGAAGRGSGATGRGTSSSFGSFDSRRGRDGNGRISFLKR